MSPEDWIIEVDIAARAGRVYTLERTAEISHPAWSKVARSRAVARDRNLTLVDTSPPAGTAFYRVKEQLR
jgi:hypothetical protein